MITATKEAVFLERSSKCARTSALSTHASALMITDVYVPRRGSDELVLRGFNANNLPEPWRTEMKHGTVITCDQDLADLKAIVHEDGDSFDWCGLQSVGELNFGKSCGLIKFGMDPTSCLEHYAERIAANAGIASHEVKVIENDFNEGEMLIIPDRMFNRMMVRANISHENMTLYAKVHGGRNSGGRRTPISTPERAPRPVPPSPATTLPFSPSPSESVASSPATVSSFKIARPSYNVASSSGKAPMRSATPDNEIASKIARLEANEKNTEATLNTIAGSLRGVEGALAAFMAKFAEHPPLIAPTGAPAIAAPVAAPPVAPAAIVAASVSAATVGGAPVVDLTNAPPSNITAAVAAAAAAEARQVAASRSSTRAGRGRGRAAPRK